MPDVHILHEGRALCGLAGVPRDWPKGERWTRLDERATATCDACLEAAEPYEVTERAGFALSGEEVKMKRILFERALDAIKALYHDTRADPAVTKAELEELREEIDGLIATLN